MIKIGIEELSTTFMGLLLKYGICHVIFILEISLLNLLSTVRVIHVFMVEDIWIIGYKEINNS